MRGTNSNHVLVLLNGMPINDQSTTNGAFDFGKDFMTNVTLVEIYIMILNIFKIIFF